MRNLVQEIHQIKEIFYKENISPEDISHEELFSETFQYDKVFKRWIEEKYLEERLKAIKEDKQGVVAMLEEERTIFSQELRRLIAEAMGNNKLSFVYIGFSYVRVLEDLKKKHRKLLKFAFVPENSFEWLLKFISKFLYFALWKEALWKLTYSRSFSYVNEMLEPLGLPEIMFRYNEKQRIFRSLNNYVDFEKEFLLTILSRMHKEMANSLFQKEIVTIEGFKEEKWVKYPYLRPGYTWVGKDGKRETYRDYKMVDSILNLKID